MAVRARTRLVLATMAASSIGAVAPARAQQATPPPRIFRVPSTIAVRPVDATAVAREITPPPSLASRPRASSVTLQATPDSATIRAFQVTRQYPLAQVRSAPMVALGRARINMAPVFANPRALFNVADRIRAQPQTAEVIADDAQVYEGARGLIIRSFLTYRIKPGVCTDNARRVQLTRVGIACSTSLAAPARGAAFANPRDPHYVADPAARAQALAKATQASAVVDAELTKQVADIRASLADPARRGQFDSAIAPGESARLAALTDDQLKAEIVNSGETSIEQTLFVPNQERAAPLTITKAPAQFGVAAGSPPQPAPPAPPATPPSPTAKPDPVAHTPLEQRIFLTGFTLGRDYEWKQRIEKTIKLCLIGCKHTYYAEVRAGFNYGFGLRFPIQLDGVYDYQNGSAKVTTTLTPIKASAAQFAATGLAPGLVFGGKELVAQVGGHAGAGYDLPFIPNADIDVPIGLDLTNYLTGDFANGYVTPPAPGGPQPKMEKIFDDIDLIGGLANFGVLGAKVFPAVKIELTSDKLSMTLHDFVKGVDVPVVSGQETVLGVEKSDASSRFAIGDPVYNVGFLITPGIDARLFVDIGLWSNNWDFPVWFPQLAVQLPPGGVDFGCHAGTVCSRGYRYSPTSHEEADVTAVGFEYDLQKWGQGFDSNWLSQCADDTCRLGIKFVRTGTIYAGRQKYNKNNATTLADMKSEFAEAESEATTLINESQARQTTNAAKSFGVLIQAVWSKQCSDKLCLDKVAGIVKFEILEMNAIQKQNPDMSTNQVIGTVGKKFAPVFQAEIDASKARAAAAAAAAPPLTPRAVKPIMMRPIGGATAPGGRPAPIRQ